jgi:50S ribosomal subunit-associated GTPase HflX
LKVFNKIDLTGLSPGVEMGDCDTIAAVRLSAVTGAGLKHLRAVLDQLAAPSGATPPDGRLEAA